MEEHLHESRLETIALAGDSPTPTESVHIDECQSCAQRLDALHLLAQELQIARHSEPTPTQMEGYTALFRQIPRPSFGERLSGWIESVRLILALDSRQAAPALGLRRAVGFGHRLLYSSDVADVELLLEAEGELWQIAGDVLPFAPETIPAPYLIELQTDATGAPVCQTESDANGRFRLADVPAGHFTLTFTPASGPLIEIVGLEIP